MKFTKLTAFIMAAFSLAACDDTTDTIGSSITNNVDNLTITDASFNVLTESLLADSVLSKTNNGIIGKVKDPETGTYLSADYMTQVAPLSSFSIDTLQYIKDANDGVVRADSSFILVSYQSNYGDTLAPMKVTAYEMTKMMPEDRNYYSNFDPMEEGYVSKDNMHASATYTLANGQGSFKIYLNKPYTKNGKTYENYGTYIMQTYMEHPEYFKSNYEFMKNVCPGFYLKYEGGIGNVANIWNTEVQFYWSRQKTIKASDGVTDSIAKGYGFNRFDGTEEVLQTNHIVNDKNSLQKLVNDESCTYLKSPAGIYTEVTLPVEEIMAGHDEQTTLNTATVTFPRINNNDENNEYAFDTPQYILMVPKDSISSFFEKGNIVNNRTSFYSAYTSTGSTASNAYVFNNISNLITAMYKEIPTANAKEWKEAHPNWNKAVLIPIELTTVTENSATIISKITHNMSLTSTRLVKGTDDYKTSADGKRVPAGPIQIKVIYSKFKEK